MENSRGAEASVEAAESGRCRALVEADIPTLAALTAAEYRHVETSGTVRDRSGFLAAIARPDHRFVLWVIEQSRVEHYGDVAVVAGEYRNQVRTPEGLLPVKRARFLRVWVLRDGAWQNVAHQATAIPVPAPAS